MGRPDPASRDPFLDRSTAPEPHATWNRPDEEELEEDEEDIEEEDLDLTDEDEGDASEYDLEKAIGRAELLDYTDDE